MSEKYIVVERIARNDGMIEYRARVTAAFCVDTGMDVVVPAEYLAGYIANELREYVADATVFDQIKEKVVDYREKDTFTCPTCGKTLEIRL